MKIMFLIFIIIHVSCSNKLHTGKYYIPYTNVNLNINKDSTFIYTHNNYYSNFSKSDFYAKNYSEGTWKMSNRYLLLKSNYSENSYPLVVTEAINENISGFHFIFDTFFLPPPTEVIWQQLQINDTILIPIMNKSVIFNDTIEIKRIKIINYYCNMLADGQPVMEYIKKFETINYNISYVKSNEFYITYNPFNAYMFYYKYFDNDSFRIKKK